MFTGIIEETGTVKEVTSRALSVSADIVTEDIKLGDSIAVDGSCLTVNAINKGTFSVDIMPETVRRTTIGRLHYGDTVNLERAMAAYGRFGGHFVQGHVDDTGKIVSATADGDAVIVAISAPKDITDYVVVKGFIAVDGISLTVVSCDDHSFSVSLVGFTRDHTTLGQKKPGSWVNLEADIIAKYVQRFTSGKSDNTIMNFLEEYDSPKTR
jgi:riboflavin synthase